MKIDSRAFIRIYYEAYSTAPTPGRWCATCILPPVQRNKAVSILSSLPPPDVSGLHADSSKIYPQFVTALYDSLIGPTARTIPTFQSVCEKLWPEFVSPIVNNEKPPGTNSRAEWDFQRLLVKNRALFQQYGEDLLVHHIISEDPTYSQPPSTKKPSSSTLPSLLYLATLVLQPLI